MKSLAGYARPVPYVSRRTSFDGLGTGSSVFNARGPIITRMIGNNSDQGIIRLPYDGAHGFGSLEMPGTFGGIAPAPCGCGSSVLGGAGIGAMIGMHPFVAVAIAFGLGWVASKHKSR